MTRCPQCYREKDDADFQGPRGLRINCTPCVERMGRMSRGLPVEPLPRDPRLDVDRLGVLWIRESHIAKLGPIPASYTSGSTCPDACSLKGYGCFAEQAYIRQHWRRAGTLGLSWSEFCAKVAELPRGRIWRHNVAGDLPGLGNDIDVPKLRQLGLAARGTRGFTYTHKPIRSAREADVVARLNREPGLTINLSADGLEHADELADLGVAPVAVVVPLDTSRFFRTPRGRKGLICPAELDFGIDCAGCGLCANPGRKSLVGFYPHGNHTARVDELVQIRRSR